MSPNSVVYQRQGRVARILLDRPDSGNEVDEMLAQDLRDACRRAFEDDETYVVIITGAGEAFSTGTPSPGTPEAMDRLRVAAAIAAIPKPTVAAINGNATGHGLELALACDLRIAADSAELALDQVLDETIPWDGGTQRLPRIVPKAVALELVLTGRRVTAGEALSMGLVNDVAPAADLMARADGLADRLAASAPIAAAYAKEALLKGLDVPLEQGLRLEADLAILLHTTDDRTEGLRAFLEKRPPEFAGR
jgi:enoyl-CoA hydratase/carnithine racemase